MFDSRISWTVCIKFIWHFIFIDVSLSVVRCILANCFIVEDKAIIFVAYHILRSHVVQRGLECCVVFFWLYLKFCMLKNIVGWIKSRWTLIAWMICIQRKRSPTTKCYYSIQHLKMCSFESFHSAGDRRKADAWWKAWCKYFIRDRWYSTLVSQHSDGISTLFNDDWVMFSVHRWFRCAKKCQF